MNAPARSEDAIETDRVKKQAGDLTAGTPPEGPYLNGQTQLLNEARPDVLEGNTFETFIDGEGI
jgi:hypothetical protein